MNIAGAMGAVKSLSPTRPPPPPKFRGREHTFLSPKRFISCFLKREGKEGQNGPLVSGVLSLSLHTLLVPLREARSGRGVGWGWGTCCTHPPLTFKCETQGGCECPSRHRSGERDGFLGKSWCFLSLP